MSSQFPASMDTFTQKVDNVDVIRAVDINNLQDSIVRIENTLTPVISDDLHLLSLCHYEGTTDGYRNLDAAESGAVRYTTGHYGQSVYIERGTTNFVKNPAFRSSTDTWTLETVTGTVTGSRISSDYIPSIDSDHCYQVAVTAAGDTDVKLKTTLEGLAAETAYTISFWVKNGVTGSNFSGSGMRIALSDGSGASGPSFTITSDWQRVHGTYTTATGQDSFVLEVRCAKTGASINDKVLFGGFQVETGSRYSSYCDGSQGVGYTWTGEANASSSLRTPAVVQYPVSSSSQVYLDPHEGTIGFWLSPDWDDTDNLTRYFFDTVSTALKKRISLYKGSDNKLNFKITEPDDTYKALVTDSAVSWEPEDGWMHIACTYAFDDTGNTWTLQVFVDGQTVAATASGTASTSSDLGNYMYLGATYNSSDYSDSKFDDFFTRDEVISGEQVSKIYQSGVPMSESTVNASRGSAVTEATVGNATQVTHGLGEIPSFIDITEKGAGLVYLDGDPTDEYFSVKCTASSINFNWRAWR